MKDHISNTKLVKGDYYYIQTRLKDLSPITILFWENFKKKCPEKGSKIKTKCAHTPWASYNTPSIELIQYGRRIGKKVYFFGGGKFPQVWILGTKFHESGYAILGVNYRVFSKNWFCQFFKIHL